MSNPFATRPGDEKLTRGAVYVDAVAVSKSAADGEAIVAISGSLPTPCHELRLRVPPPGAGGQLDIEAWSVMDQNRLCAQVLHPFSVRLPIRAADGKVTVNGVG